MDPLSKLIRLWLEKNADTLEIEEHCNIPLLADKIADWLDSPEGIVILMRTKHNVFKQQ